MLIEGATLKPYDATHRGLLMHIYVEVLAHQCQVVVGFAIDAPRLPLNQCQFLSHHNEETLIYISFMILYSQHDIAL